MQRKKAVLACRRLKGGHTYDVLANIIQKIHWKIEIDGKVCMTTTDNGSNFVKAKVLNGLKKRFQPCVESTDCLLSAAFHPHFKLSWIPLLPLLGYEDVSGVRIKIQQKRALIVNSKVETDTHSTSCQSASSNDQFFGEALAKKPRQCNSSETLLDDFLKEKYESQSKGIATLLSSTTLRELFVKYNTAIPSSAAVECLFSLGKDVLKPKRSGLSD